MLFLEQIADKFWRRLSFSTLTLCVIQDALENALP